MKRKEIDPLKHKKVQYYFDEAFILLIVLIGVISADAFHRAIHGRYITMEDFTSNIPMLIISALIAVIVYGSMYTRPYSDKQKAPLPKRMGAALTQGLTWRLLLSN